MSNINYKQITAKLQTSLENLYENSEYILNQIEEGMDTDIITNPVVGFQGAKGAYGEEATYAYFRGAWSDIISHNSFEDVIEALLEGTIDYGVLPIENSSAGEVFDTYDLIKSNKLYIVGEQTIKIEHNLIGIKGTKIEDIREVYSHPQGLSQTKEFLKEHDNMIKIPYINTATACEHVAKLNDKTKAAIASRRAASIHGLEILEPNIHFNKNNSTRFIVLAKKMLITDSCDKISIVFHASHTSGSLYNILGHFTYNGLNLLKIQSRPLLEKKWEYYFFADLEGNLQDVNVLIALSKVKEACPYFKILGNYEQNK